MFRRMILLLLLLSLGRGMNGYAQKKSDLERINNDVRIQESILEQLLEASREQLFRSRNIQGFYFTDYGLLFTVNLSEGIYYLEIVKKLKDQNVEVKAKARSSEKKDATIVISPPELADKYFNQKGNNQTFSLTFETEMDEEELKDWYQKLDRKIITFFEHYVDIPNNLTSQERISVVVFLNQRFGNGELARHYQVQKNEILRRRQKQLSEKQFIEKIVIKPIKEESQPEELRIMEAILETALSDQKRRPLFSRSGIHAIYLEDLGVMFRLGDFISLLHMEEEEVEKTWEAELLKNYEVALKRYKERTTQFERRIEEVENKLLSLMATYGVNTLSDLPENGSIIVAFSVEPYLARAYSEVLIRARKTDLRALHEGKVTLDQLRRKVEIIHFK